MVTKRTQRSSDTDAGKASAQDEARVAALAAFADGLERDALLYGSALDGMEPQIEAARVALDAYGLEARLSATDRKVAEEADAILRDDLQGLAQIEAEMDEDDGHESAVLAKDRQGPSHA